MAKRNGKNGPGQESQKPPVSVLIEDGPAAGSVMTDSPGQAQFSPEEYQWVKIGKHLAIPSEDLAENWNRIGREASGMSVEDLASMLNGAGEYMMASSYEPVIPASVRGKQVDLMADNLRVLEDGIPGKRLEDAVEEWTKAEAARNAEDLAKNGYCWEKFEDSGAMVTKYGHRIFNYDLATYEVQDPETGRYSSANVYSDDWFKQMEEKYRTRIEPKERQFADGIAHGVYFPYFNLPDFLGEGKDCEYVAISDTKALPMSDFKAIASGMRQAEREHFSDTVIDDGSVARYLRAGLNSSEQSERPSVSFEYEGKKFTLAADKFVALDTLMTGQAPESPDRGNEMDTTKNHGGNNKDAEFPGF